jgi:hypothetical protein
LEYPGSITKWAKASGKLLQVDHVSRSNDATKRWRLLTFFITIQRNRSPPPPARYLDHVSTCCPGSKTVLGQACTSPNDFGVSGFFFFISFVFSVNRYQPPSPSPSVHHAHAHERSRRRYVFSFNAAGRVAVHYY